MYTKNEVICRVCGIVSGLLLGLPNILGVFAPVQCFALLPILICVSRWEFKRSVLLASGMYMALGFTIPQMILLKLPVPISAILILVYIIVMMPMVLAAGRLLGQPGVVRCFVFAGLVVVLDWTNYTALPMWGTAQSIARPWSAYWYAIAYTSVTGMGGIVFLLVFVQSVAAVMINQHRIEKPMLKAVAVTAGVFFVLNLYSLMGGPVDSVKVAAVGWNKAAVQEYGDTYLPKGFENIYAKQVRLAAKQGAKLIISPEMGFYVDRYDRSKWVGMLTTLAVGCNVHLVVGYFDASRNKNQILLVDNRGRMVDEYTKTYLTPFERSNRGNGQPAIFNVAGVRAGGMICQDDNYTSISRRYGRAATGLVAVPTLDWAHIRFAHLQNCIHRTIESRYALVRASYEGISAIVSARGKVIASFDNVTNGIGMVVGDVEIYNKRTIFSYAGNWFAIIARMFVGGYLIWYRWLTTA